MTDARDIVEEQTLKECGCCGNMHIMEWSDDYVASLRKQLEDARSEALEEALTAVVGTNADGDRSALSAYQKCIYAIHALKGKS